MWMYCDPDNYDLKVAVAAHLGVGAENVVVGEGIDGLLSLVARMYVAPGDAVVTSLGAYPTFNFHIAGVGGRLVAVAYENDRESLDGLLAAVRRDKAPLVYLSNPDNPMGSWWEAAELSRFIEALPETTMLVLDEAYGELGPASALPPIDVSRPNVIRMRTFSKAYGLAGIRCGYAVAEAQVIRDFEKIRNHYGVSRMAQIAGVEALADQDYLQSVVARVAAGRARIAGIAEANGLKPLASATNFVTIDCGRDGAFALKVLQALLSRDVFIRKPMVPGARPLHPGQRRPRPRARHLRRGTARRAGSGARELSSPPRFQPMVHGWPGIWQALGRGTCSAKPVRQSRKPVAFARSCARFGFMGTPGASDE